MLQPPGPQGCVIQHPETWADRRSAHLWIFLFLLFFLHFSPACCLSQGMFVAQLAIAAQQHLGAEENPQHNPVHRTQHINAPYSWGPGGQDMTGEGPGAAKLAQILLPPSGTGQATPAPQPSFGDTREPAGILVLLLVTASGLVQETRTWQEREETVETLHAPACPCSLSRHPRHAQKLQLLQTAFGATVPAVRQGLHWGKRWPYLALSPHHSQGLKADFGQAMAAQAQWPQFRICPLCPLHAPPLTGKHCLQPHFRQQPLPQWLSKKCTSGSVFFFLEEEYF